MVNAKSTAVYAAVLFSLFFTSFSYHKGSVLKRRQTWMFGLVERGENGKAYVEVVKDRKGATLLKILYDHVEEGTTIISDTWSSYNRIAKLKKFKNLSVNHKYHFVDPINGACTNKIEGLWNQAKKKFKEMNGCSNVNLKSYLDEFIWRTNNTANRVDCNEKILQEIAEFYPVDGHFDFFNYESDVSILSIDPKDVNDEGSEEEDIDDEPDELDGTCSQRPKVPNNTNQVEEVKSSYERLMESKIQSLNEKLSQLTIKKNLVKANALLLEKNAFVSPQTSSEAEAKVTEVLANTNEDLSCELCSAKGIEKKCKGEWGLMLHRKKSHRRK
ncbi:ISXO2-like domain-containing [Brachionus plicatilis]|uniref:ISXO2-like domain-containing n=1 Tax=Brachionus plicatilis TaxID=10195 RepID=A0A3M7RIA7_BRAPC|nr:ISXO2-like domain-containing [Brachionus plicatilis]